jgi:ABC-2 type transport system ATP-binding protein
VVGLSKRFGRVVALDGLDLDVREGESLGLLGPNGAGKSTLMSLLAGIARPSAGMVDVAREGSPTRTAVRRHIGFAPQTLALYPQLSAAENLRFFARLHGVPARAIEERVRHGLQIARLERRAHDRVGAFSGGMQRRLNLAAAVLHAPRLLLLDEPTAGVDPKARRDFWDELHRLAADGITVLVSTHYMDEAERCHELVYIAEGRVLARGSERDILAGAGLTVWAAHGDDAPARLRALHGADGVLSVAAFGNAVHVAGRDAAALEHAIAPWRDDPALRWSRTEPNLEDVFISLIGRTA